MRLIIAGGRDLYISFEELDHHIESVCFDHYDFCDVTEVVCGKAPGIDTCGEEWATRRGIHVEPFPAEWDRYGNAAGPIRNGKMADYADAAIVFWDGKSRGSGNMIAQMKQRKKDVFPVIWTRKNRRECK